MCKFLNYTLYDFQTAFIEDALTFLRGASSGERRLYASPTGTGKSVMELAVQSQLEGCWILTPRLEIIAGMLQKLGYDTTNCSQAKIIWLALAHMITTPVRFRNMLLNGEVSEFKYLIVDEGHHHSADTYQQIDIFLGQVPSIALTATPYRGTPKSTKVLRDQWGDPHWCITYPEAMQAGYITMPTCKTIGLVDDDNITIKNGEFTAESTNDAYLSRLQAVVEMSRPWYKDKMWDKPTMYSLPSNWLAHTFQGIMETYGFHTYCVTQETSYGDRQAIFKDVEDRKAALIHINVVSEGVDLKMRRGVDMKPCLSPVAWLQQFGRLTRPSLDFMPEYICTNRNFLRHAYLLSGCVPIEAFLQSQEEFPTPSVNGVGRVMGLEAIGRFKAEEMPLASGLVGYVYRVKTVEGITVTNYAAIVHPAVAEPIWAKASDIRGAYDPTTMRYEVAYGKWELCSPPSDLSGFASATPKKITDKQKAWWKRSARYHGLDPAHEPTQKTFAALPILKDLNLRLV